MCGDSAGLGGRGESGSALIQTHPLCHHQESLIFKPTEPESLDHEGTLLAAQEPGPFFLEGRLCLKNTGENCSLNFQSAVGVV